MNIKTYTNKEISTAFNNNIKTNINTNIIKLFESQNGTLYKDYDNVQQFLTPNNLNNLQNTYLTSYNILNTFYTKPQNISISLASCATNFINYGLKPLTAAIGIVSAFSYQDKTGTIVQAGASTIQEYLQFHRKELQKLNQSTPSPTAFYISANAPFVSKNYGTTPNTPFSSLTQAINQLQKENYQSNTNVYFNIMSNIYTDYQHINTTKVPTIANNSLNIANNSKLIIRSYNQNQLNQENINPYNIIVSSTFLANDSTYRFFLQISHMYVEFSNLILSANVQACNGYNPAKHDQSILKSCLFAAILIKNYTTCILNNISAYNFFKGDFQGYGIFSVHNMSKLIIKNNLTIIGANNMVNPLNINSKSLKPCPNTYYETKRYCSFQ